MLSANSEITLTIIVTTTMIVLFGATIVYFLFKYQQKRQLHQKEMAFIKESFTQTLLKSKLEIQEQTLDHISKELHSNISQTASLININLSTILEVESNEDLIETKSLAKQLLTELRGISASLNTDYIMKIGFSRALESELLRVSKSMKSPAILSKSGEVYSLSADREIILFRLCQEVLNNAIRYSEATQLKISLYFLEEAIELRIIDNGVGFNINNLEKEDLKKESTGILNIKKRAEVISATLEINSQLGEGTEVFIRIPKKNV